MGEFQSVLYLQIIEIVGAIVNLVNGEFKKRDSICPAVECSVVSDKSEVSP